MQLNLKKDLKKIEKERQTQSKKRAEEFRCALVGYTNAGKSTLFNALTGSKVYIQDQLFATLDTTIRHLEISESHKVLLSDTVGFIRKLPHHLVASFRSTLKEVIEANLLLILLDMSSPQIIEHAETIENVLKDLDAKKIGHITPKPVELIENIILHTTDENDVRTCDLHIWKITITM